MGKYKDDISRFIYEICYKDIWAAVQSYLQEHRAALDLTYSRIKYPDSILIEDMLLEFAKNIRISEDTLLFDAVISCSLILTEEDYAGTREGELNEWMTASCEATVTDRLESLKVTRIEQYVPGKQESFSEQAASKNIVPILKKKDLEAEAEKFLSVYFPEALDHPVSVPIDDIAKKMNLTVVQGNRITNDFSVFGEIFFTSGKAEVYDIFKVSTSVIDVTRGTILIDAYTFWERNLGCVKNTIAHEVYHWYKHRMYAAIKHILYGKDYVACRCPSNMVYPKEKDPWTDEQRMEWQANSMAPRILMPYKAFRMKVDELYKKYDFENTLFKDATLNLIAEDLSKFYGVSRQSALIRMIETGYPEAASVYDYNEDSEVHNYLDEHDAFYEYRTNKEFQKLIDSGLFIYVDGHFVINDEQFVSNEDGHYSLTDYAWANLDDCTLQFTWQTISQKDAARGFPFEIFHRENATRKVSKYDSSKNASVVQMSEQLKEKRAEFERQNNIRKVVTPAKTCWELIYEIIQSKGISKAHFCSATSLGEEVYRKAEKNIGTKPSLRTIVAIGRGLDLDIATVERLLQLAGHAFDDSDESQALKFCITGYSGKSVDDANEFLESYGYEPLGTKQLK